MAYDWPRNLCNGQGVPYEKLAGVYLEKTSAGGGVIASDTFTTQEAVDQAWADGYHSPGMPETRDCMGAEEGEDLAPDPETETAERDVLLEPVPNEEPKKEQVGPTIYCCDDCGFKTASEHGLKVHRATKHKE